MGVSGGREHRELALGERHAVHNWEYANAAAREAATFTELTGLIGALALQVDDGSYWRLASIAPTTWVSAGTPASALAAAVADLEAAIAAKASESEVQAALDALTAALATKLATATFDAYVTATATTLDAKADAVETAAALAAINTEIDTKADQSEVDSDIAGLTALVATKIDSADLGQPDGIAQLDNGGKVPASQLPSYVDDVIEAANFASFPATGAAGAIYVALDTGLVYRWGGSAYVEISAKPGSTDAVPEGATNLYHTTDRVRATPLTGLATSNSAIVATDTLLVAAGKAQGQINAKAPLASPALTGSPTSATPATGSNGTQIATTAWVRTNTGVAASLGALDLNGASGSAEEFWGRRVAVSGAPADTAAAAALNWPFVTGSVWWNVDTFGSISPSIRVTQIAYFGFTPTSTANRIFFRQKHDTNWGAWREMLMQPAAGNKALGISQAGATDVNYLDIRSGAAGQGVRILALGADENVSLELAAKGTGSVYTTTPADGTNSTRIATTAFVASGFAPKNNPVFTGTAALAAANFSGAVTFAVAPSGTFAIDGSGPGGQANGLYVADLGSTQGTTLNPTFTLGLMYQLSASRSNGFSVDSSGYLYGFRSHSNAGTYTWASKTRFADQWTTARTLTLGGDLSGSVAFSGSANFTLTATVSGLATKAPLDSPALTGTPTAPTAAPGTNTTQISTTAFVQEAVAALVDSAPGTIDTLNELAAALGDDPNFATTMTTALAAKAPLESPAFTGTPTGVTKAHVGLDQVDNTADADKPVSTAAAAALALKAPLEAPSFTGGITSNGSLGNVIVPSTGEQLQFSRDSFNYLSATGSGSSIVYRIGTGSHRFETGNTSLLQFEVRHTASSVNYWGITGAATGARPSLRALGADADIGLTIASKGTSEVYVGSWEGGTAFRVNAPASTVNYVRATGAATGSGPTVSANGTDTNIDLRLAGKGTGVVRLDSLLNVIASGTHAFRGDNGRMQFLATDLANLNRWRWGWNLSGTADGDFYLQHSNDGFVANFDSRINFAAAGGGALYGTWNITGTITTSGGHILANHAAGRLAIGGTNDANQLARIVATPGSGTGGYGVRVNPTALPATMTNFWGSYNSLLTTVASAFTMSSLRHFHAEGLTLGAGSIVTTGYGFQCAASALNGVGTKYGFASELAAGANTYSFFVPAGGALASLGGGLSVQTDASDTSPTITVHDKSTTGDNTFIAFGTEASYTTRGSIDFDRVNNVVRYNTASDMRLKVDLGLVLDSNWDWLKALKVHRFKWKSQGEGAAEKRGFFAQELHALSPQSVRVGNDDTDENGNLTKPWGVDEKRLIPDLVVALQEAQKRIEVLETMLVAETGLLSRKVKAVEDRLAGAKISNLPTATWATKFVPVTQ